MKCQGAVSFRRSRMSSAHVDISANAARPLGPQKRCSDGSLGCHSSSCAVMLRALGVSWLRAISAIVRWPSQPQGNAGNENNVSKNAKRFMFLKYLLAIIIRIVNSDTFSWNRARKVWILQKRSTDEH